MANFCNIGLTNVLTYIFFLKLCFEHIFIATFSNWDWAQVQNLRSPSSYLNNLFIERREVHKNMKMKGHE